MRGGKNQAVAETEIPNGVAGLASIEAVAAASPDLHLVFAFHGACLRASGWNTEQRSKKEKSRNCSPQQGNSFS